MDIKMAEILSREQLNEIFIKFKEIYVKSTENIDELVTKINQYGHLPYSHKRALDELTDGQVVLALEAKLIKNNTFNGNEFTFEEISPVKRAGYKDSSWIKKEQHSIKLINLAALGNDPDRPARFIDLLRQILILPAGNLEKGILATTAYIIPFHPREFGCAYLPAGSGVSPALEDALMKEKLGLSAKEQVKLFLSLCQLAGHPTMFDVLPQTARFSKIVLSNPYVARWFDINQLINSLENELDKILSEYDEGTSIVRDVISSSLRGSYKPIPEEFKTLADEVEGKLLTKKKEFSNLMLTKENQEKIEQRAREVIANVIGKMPEYEEDIVDHGQVITTLIKEGLWPAPGGAWCSCGVPVFDKMNKGGDYPTFGHYDIDGNDVTHFANLDCQTPYYFVYLENGEYNQKVVDFYVDFLKKIQRDYKFDAFRVDHIDHIADRVSEDRNQNPISYRAPRKVLGEANRALKEQIHHFAALAEYMLWDNLLKEYHVDMGFDLLWGSDIVSQCAKTPSTIVEENEELAKYNESFDTNRLSILKTYNNQDGEFRAINQYPGQLGEDGALFKWFKFRFLPHNNGASRPSLYVDGDESFTKTGIERVIGLEVSMERNRNDEFFQKFDAIYRFSMNNDILLSGTAKVFEEKEDGFVSWVVENGSNEALFVVANQNNPTEVSNEDGKFVEKKSKPIKISEVKIPENYKVISEYHFEDGDFVEKQTEQVFLNTLNPAGFHFYRIEKC